MLSNGIKETTTTAGTGTLTLASATGFARFSSLPVGSVVEYGIETAGGDWEWGLGTVGASDTLARTAVIATMVSGAYTSVGASALSLSGTSTVRCTAHAQAIAPVMPHVSSSAAARYVLPDGLEPSTNSKTLASNVPRGACLRWSCAATISHLVCEVNTLAGTGTDRIQLGIYNCLPDGGIGDLIARTGDIAPNTTGIKSAALSGGTIRLPPGWYWWIIASNVGPAVRAYNGGGTTNSTLATPMGHAGGTIGPRNSQASFTALGGGWTALPTTLTLSALSSVVSDFSPTVGATVA